MKLRLNYGWKMRAIKDQIRTASTAKETISLFMYLMTAREVSFLSRKRRDEKRKQFPEFDAQSENYKIRA